ncbi:MAG: hypothetical protein RIF46_14530, partial [Cyclobacteriaceae bacterium]
MSVQDLVVTPIFLFIIFTIAWVMRSRMTNRAAAKWFLPALGIKCFGAIALGLVYQFYYGGGDTFNYWEHGSAHIWAAFLDSPLKGLDMIFGDINNPEYFQYYSEIWLRRSESSVFIIRIAAIFDVFTLHTYSSTALLFALLSMSGSWLLFRVIHNTYNLKTSHLFFIIFL